MSPEEQFFRNLLARRQAQHSSPRHISWRASWPLKP